MLLDFWCRPEAGDVGAMEARRIANGSGAGFGQAHLVHSCSSGANRGDLSTPAAALKDRSPRYAPACILTVNERLLSAVISTDRRNTIILTEVDGVLFNEKKVQARGF